ncbi:MAG: hypothetical protein COV73_06585 [Candidatus Omnitrophica bacterium CG11_big_fil_rev_8_21_14_0_20_43_6]|nr:MAG: hypothetical protein COV73_06585 [Candidatus Omnitrophica bacterium CG11_big_fil_rev_8_21_14_0_20_43_6]
MIKKILLLSLVLICLCVFLGLSSVDKRYFTCPIEYKNDIRHDHRGGRVICLQPQRPADA